MCESTPETESTDESVCWFDYFERNYPFFSAMLASKGAPFFRSWFLEFVIEDIKNVRNDKNLIEGKNQGLNEEVMLQFFGTAYVGAVEWWFKNGMPYPPHVMEQQIGRLFERNL
jgi:hypothetical protein